MLRVEEKVELLTDLSIPKLWGLASMGPPSQHLPARGRTSAADQDAAPRMRYRHSLDSGKVFGEVGAQYFTLPTLSQRRVGLLTGSVKTPDRLYPIVRPPQARHTKRAARKLQPRSHAEIHGIADLPWSYAGAGGCCTDA